MFGGKTSTWRKKIGVAIIIAAAFFFFSWIMVAIRQTSNKPLRFGITYSTMYASYLGLDVMKTYQDLVEDLGVRAVRLPVYWTDIESTENEYVWDQLDAIIKYSEQHNVKLTLAIGRKVPRWPECFIPSWAISLSQAEQQRAVLDYEHEVISRYKTSPAVERWQVENEPFFPFGVCVQIREKDLREEIAAVHAFDTRPVQVTASGEMEPWKLSAKMSDVLGISVYRMTWNSVFGYFTYPLSPLFYRVRAFPVRLMGKPVIVSELQAEPWFPEDVKSESVEYWYNAFTAEDFKENVRFVEDIGVDEAYFWGAEWWQYARQHGETRLWDTAKTFFQQK